MAELGEADAAPRSEHNSEEQIRESNRTNYSGRHSPSFDTGGSVDENDSVPSMLQFFTGYYLLIKD